MLDTVPYLLLAVHVKHPESSANTSAMTKVQISSKANKAEMVTDFMEMELRNFLILDSDSIKVNRRR